MIRMIPVSLFLLGLLVISMRPVQAATFTANDATSLINAINDANANPDLDTITLTDDIRLESVADTSDGPSGLPAITTIINIEGNGYTIERSSSAPEFRIFYVDGGVLSLIETTVRNGLDTDGDNGGAIKNVFGTVFVAGSTLTDNRVRSSGSGGTGIGGAIDNFGGIVTIERSILSNNSARLAGGVFNNGGATLIANSTLSNNTASSGGGALYNITDGPLTLENVTVTGNSANRGGGVYVENSGAFLDYSNTLIANNNGGDCVNDGSDNITLNVNNLVEDGGCDATLSGDPLLGASVNGVFPLLEGSPAIDAADASQCPATDQLGTSRPQGDGCDIGAYEVPVDPQTGELIDIQQPPPPRLNQWNATADEDRAEAYGVSDDVYAKVLMQDNAWLETVGRVPGNLVEYGVILAIDVYEIDGDQVFDNYEKVCLQGEGRLIYLDATTSPRQQIEITETTLEDGYTCGWVPNAGMLVLIPDEQR